MVAHKIKKIPLKINIFGRFGQNMIIFGGYSCFFQKSYIFKSWGFLRCIQCIRTLLLSYQKQFFDNFFRFFTIRGDPCDLGRPKNLRKLKTKVLLWTELQMDQESRRYSMFKRLEQNKNLPTMKLFKISVDMPGTKLQLLYILILGRTCLVVLVTKHPIIYIASLFCYIPL